MSVAHERNDSGHHLKRSAIDVETPMTLNDAAWLILAVVAGLLLTVAWAWRERAIHRRRRAEEEEAGQ